MPITRMSKALASVASREPMRPMPTITSVLPPSSSSRFEMSPIMPRHLLRGLVVARLRNLPRHGEDQRDRMLGHRALVDALRAGEADAGRAQRIARVLVGAGADRLDEGEPAAPRRSARCATGRRPPARPPRRCAPSARRGCAPRTSRGRCCAARSARPCDRRRGRSRWSACLGRGEGAHSWKSLPQ